MDQKDLGMINPLEIQPPKNMHYKCGQIKGAGMHQDYLHQCFCMLLTLTELCINQYCLLN